VKKPQETFVLTHNPRNHMFKTAKQFFSDSPTIRYVNWIRHLTKYSSHMSFLAGGNHQTWQKSSTKPNSRQRLKKPYVSKCEDPRFSTCPFIHIGQSIAFKKGMKYNVNSNMTCKLKNLLYWTTYPACGENYIGQTGTEFVCTSNKSETPHYETHHVVDILIYVVTAISVFFFFFNKRGKWTIMQS
jgi:hypothetical protein